MRPRFGGNIANHVGSPRVQSSEMRLPNMGDRTRIYPRPFIFQQRAYYRVRINHHFCKSQIVARDFQWKASFPSP